MKKCFIVIVCFYLIGCSTQVHLITQGYSDIQAAKISNKISNLGFDVSRSNIAIPSHYTNQVIALNPAHSNTDDLNNLQVMLEKIGLGAAQIERFGANKHFYNDGHIGLYLREPSVDINLTMPPYIEARSCQYGYATLGFSANQRVYLETSSNLNGELELHTQLGKWEFDGADLILFIADYPLARFTKHEIIRQTPLGERNALLYSAQQKNHEVDMLNCSFEVIFMN